MRQALQINNRDSTILQVSWRKFASRHRWAAASCQRVLQSVIDVSDSWERLDHQITIANTLTEDEAHTLSKGYHHMNYENIVFYCMIHEKRHACVPFYSLPLSQQTYKKLGRKCLWEETVTLPSVTPDPHSIRVLCWSPSVHQSVWRTDTQSSEKQPADCWMESNPIGPETRPLSSPWLCLAAS